MLKLVSSNPNLSLKFRGQSQKIDHLNERTSFASEVLLQGRNLYLMRARNLSHYLECDLTLEVEEGQHEDESNHIICHFPKIEDEQMSNFIHEDDTLCETIMVEFHMKVFKQLLVFCTTHYAATLTIYTDATQADNFKIYRGILNSGNQMLASKEEPTEIIIIFNQYTVDIWINFMNRVTLELRQTLWQSQRTNPAIRHYLKSHPFEKN